MHAFAVGCRHVPRLDHASAVGNSSVASGPMISEQLPDDPAAEPLPDHGDVWYVSYGSNMSAGRLARTSRAARRKAAIATTLVPNSSLPRRSVPVDLPGALYFAGDSRQWGGGVAFYDHDAREPWQAPTAARAYLVTAQQFADVAARRCTASRRRATRSRRSSSGGSTVVGTTSVRVATRPSSRSACSRMPDAAVHLAPRDRPRRAHPAFRGVPQDNGAGSEGVARSGTTTRLGVLRTAGHPVGGEPVAQPNTEVTTT